MLETLLLCLPVALLFDPSFPIPVPFLLVRLDCSFFEGLEARDQVPNLVLHLVHSEACVDLVLLDQCLLERLPLLNVVNLRLEVMQGRFESLFERV